MYDKSLRNYISNIKKNIKLKTGIVLLIALTCLLVSGCTQAESQDENKELIQGLLEHELTTPNEKTTRALSDLDAWAEEQNESGPFSSEFNTYLKDTYGTYFTDSGYEKFVSMSQALLFHQAANKYDYQTTVTNIEVEQNKDVPTNYDFTAHIVYQKEGNEKMNGEVTGIAIVRPGGIEEIKYLGDKKILKMLTLGEE